MSILVTEYWRSGLNIGEMRVFPANKIAAARTYYDKLRHQNHSGLTHWTSRAPARLVWCCSKDKKCSSTASK